MRLFVGIPLADTVIDELSAIPLRLQSSGDGLRWSAPDSWHITLQFLGNTGAEEYSCMVERLAGLRSAVVPVQLEGLGCFDRAGVFFAEVGLTQELLLLQKRVVAATGLCGFMPETRPYHPHVTLARTKGKKPSGGLDRLKNSLRRQPRFSRFVAEAFVLYESLPSPSGSRYEIRERFRLEE